MKRLLAFLLLSMIVIALGNATTVLSKSKGSPQAPSVLGWCCKDGKVVKTTKSACPAKAPFSTDEPTLEKACIAESEGYCLLKESIVSATKARCKSDGGSFFTQRKQVENALSAQKGWCIDRDDLLKMTRGKCTKRKAVFYLDEGKAQKAFGDQTGWCYKKLKLRKVTRDGCLSQKGDFHIDKKAAEQQLKVVLAAEKSTKGSAAVSKNKVKKAPTMAPVPKRKTGLKSAAKISPQGSQHQPVTKMSSPPSRQQADLQKSPSRFESQPFIRPSLQVHVPPVYHDFHRYLGVTVDYSAPDIMPVTSIELLKGRLTRHTWSRREWEKGGGHDIFKPAGSGRLTIKVKLPRDIETGIDYRIRVNTDAVSGQSDPFFVATGYAAMDEGDRLKSGARLDFLTPRPGDTLYLGQKVIVNFKVSGPDEGYRLIWLKCINERDDRGNPNIIEIHWTQWNAPVFDAAGLLSASVRIPQTVGAVLGEGFEFEALVLTPADEALHKFSGEFSVMPPPGDSFYPVAPGPVALSGTASTKKGVPKMLPPMPEPGKGDDGRAPAVGLDTAESHMTPRPLLLPDLLVSGIWLNERCEVQIQVRNVGRGSIPDEQFSHPDAIVYVWEGAQVPLRIPLSTVDPDGRLKSPGGEVVYDTGVKIVKETSLHVNPDYRDTIEEDDGETYQGNNEQFEYLACAMVPGNSRPPEPAIRIVEPRRNLKYDAGDNIGILLQFTAPPGPDLDRMELHRSGGLVHTWNRGDWAYDLGEEGPDPNSAGPDGAMTIMVDLPASLETSIDGYYIKIFAGDLIAQSDDFTIYAEGERPRRTNKRLPALAELTFLPPENSYDLYLGETVTVRLNLSGTSSPALLGIRFKYGRCNTVNETIWRLDWLPAALPSPDASGNFSFSFTMPMDAPTGSEFHFSAWGDDALGKRIHACSGLYRVHAERPFRAERRAFPSSKPKKVMPKPSPGSANAQVGTATMQIDARRIRPQPQEQDEEESRFAAPGPMEARHPGIVPPCEGVDLIITQLRVERTSYGVAVYPTIRNRCDGSTEVPLPVELSYPGCGDPCITTTFGVFGPGEEATMPGIGFDQRTPETVEITYMLDPEDIITEVSETNNSCSIVFGADEISMDFRCP